MKTGRLSIFVVAIGVCQAATGSFSSTVEPFVKKNCIGCHNARTKTADVDLESRRPADVATKDRGLWERVAAKVGEGSMPPKGLPRPDEASKTAFTTWLDSQFAHADRKAPPDPGRVTARRLNRVEYNNTVRDLLAVSFQPAADFPPDDSGYGFDNIGDVLSLSPVLMEKYMAAAEQIARRAIPSQAAPKPTLERHRAPDHPPQPAEFTAEHPIRFEGEYDIRTAVAGQSIKAGKMLRLTLTVDGKETAGYDVNPAADHPRGFDHHLKLAPGDHTLKAKLTATVEGGPVTFRIDSFEIRGPFNPSPVPPPPSHERIFICGHSEGAHQPECARLILSDLARRAFRRPVTEAEVAPYQRFFEMARADGDSFERAMRVPLQALLVSPEFLFRVERDAKPDDPKASHRINEFELATRLSYFLWSSAPDETLFKAAGLEPTAEARGAGSPGEAHDAGPEGLRASGQLRRTVAGAAQS